MAVKIINKNNSKNVFQKLKKNKCNLCGENKKLCEAHLVPKAFANDLKNNSKKNFISLKDHHDPKKGHKAKMTKQNLDFDKNILCRECDNEILNLYESHFIEKVREYAQSNLRNTNFYNHARASKIKLRCNTRLFQLALVSILYKCSISNMSNIDLGDKYETMFKKWLKNKKIDNKEKNLCEIYVLGFHKSEQNLNGILFPNYMGKSKLNHLYKFELLNLSFFIKIGQGKILYDWPTILDKDDFINIALLEGNAWKNLHYREMNKFKQALKKSKLKL
ncbi:hypothetical protein AAEX28_00825 [Lentisphaerota bacterium WC36G]|nr:hypothetical protein LJT99_03705 [Lentisphaerae bacterium WC36]